MKVRVIYFGMLKDAVGRQNEEVELPEGATLQQLVRTCIQQNDVIANFESVLAFSVNQEYATLGMTLHEGDEIAMLPPVSGGNIIKGIHPRARLVREAIDAKAVAEAIKQQEDGAVSVFDGIVRNNTRGRKTLYLDYEAYEEMALKQMERLAEEAITRFKVRDIAMVHRLGRIGIGETSVLIAVAAAHRGAAMDACRFLIDSLKKTVPIWKKEFFEDGAVWADGEPFPAELRPFAGQKAGRQ